MTKTVDDDADLADLLFRARLFLARNRRMIFGAALGGAVLLGIVALTAEKRYSSTLQIIVSDRGVNPNAPREGGAAELLSFIESQAVLIGSRDILRKVVEVADLASVEEYQKPDPSFFARIIGAIKDRLRFSDKDRDSDPLTEGIEPESHELRQLRRNLSISRRDKTNIISVSVESASPALAARLARTVGEVYIDDRRENQQERAHQLANWVDSRVLELRQKLSDAEDSVATYRITHDLISGRPEATLGEQQLIELNSVLIETRAALAEKRATYARSQQLLESGGDLEILPEVQDREVITQMRIRLLDLRLRESELRRQNPNDSRLPVISQEREEVEAQLALEISRMVAMIRHQVETLEAREALIADALDEAGKRSGEESLSTVKLRELERVAEGYQALYERYLGTAGIVDEEVSLLLSSIDIVEHPVMANLPFYPTTKLFTLWGLLLGGASGTVVSILREAMARGFTTAAQIEGVLGLPVLAMLPAPDPLPNLRISVIRQPGHSLAEGVRAVRLDLAGPDGHQRGRSLLVTSVRVADGAPDLAMALAVSLAQAGGSVLLVDATPGGYGLAGAMTPVAGAGLAEVLAEGAGMRPETQHSDQLPGVDILPRGKAVGGPDLLSGPMMRGWLERMRDSYDLVIVMAAPVQDSPDTRFLARMADQTILALRMSETPRQMALAAAGRLGPDAAAAVVALGCDARRTRNHGETRFLHDFA